MNTTYNARPRPHYYVTLPSPAALALAGECPSRAVSLSAFLREAATSRKVADAEHKLRIAGQVAAGMGSYAKAALNNVRWAIAHNMEIRIGGAQ